VTASVKSAMKSHTGSRPCGTRFYFCLLLFAGPRISPCRSGGLHAELLSFGPSGTLRGCGRGFGLRLEGWLAMRSKP